MKHIFLTLVLLAWSFNAYCQNTNFTDFYCHLNGTNINSGSTTNASANYSYDAGDWSSGTSIFTLIGADLSGVQVGMWASIWTNATAPTNAVYVARITGVDDGADTITFSATAAAGTKPGDGTGNTSVRVGGAWRGTYGTVDFPFNFVTTNLVNANSTSPRVNFWSGYSNTTSVGINHALSGPIAFQGYTTLPGDGGKGILDGGGGSYVVLKFTGLLSHVLDFIVQNSSSSSLVNHGIQLGASGSSAVRCSCNTVGGSGIYLSSANTFACECEVYNCVTSANTTIGGIWVAVGSIGVLRCFIHDNLSNGLRSDGPPVINCISVSNKLAGFYINANTVPIIGCDSVSNLTHGIYFAQTGPAFYYIENCNLIANRSYGISSITNQLRLGPITHCYFGSGDQANVLGDYSPNIGVTNSMIIEDNGSYGSGLTPYINTSVGNYSLSATASTYGRGRGSFTTYKTNGLTIGFPSVGAAGGTNSGTASSEHSSVFLQ